MSDTDGEAELARDPGNTPIDELTREMTPEELADGAELLQQEAPPAAPDLPPSAD